MTISFPNVAKLDSLELFLADVERIKLFSNDLTPSATTVISDFTELAVSGYSAIELDPNNFEYTLSGSIYVATYNTSIRWDFIGTGSAYGYYITNAAGTKYKWSERFPNGVFNIVNPSFAEIIPRLTSKQQA